MILINVCLPDHNLTSSWEIFSWLKIFTRLNTAIFNTKPFMKQGFRCQRVIDQSHLKYCLYNLCIFLVFIASKQLYKKFRLQCCVSFNPCSHKSVKAATYGNDVKISCINKCSPLLFWDSAMTWTQLFNKASVGVYDLSHASHLHISIEIWSSVRCVSVSSSGWQWSCWSQSLMSVISDTDCVIIWD